MFNRRVFQGLTEVWKGQFYLKSDSAMVEFRFVGGNRAIVGDALSTIRDNIVRISQRMRLEPTQLEAISNNLRVSGPSEVKLENY